MSSHAEQSVAQVPFSEGDQESRIPWRASSYPSGVLNKCLLLETSGPRVRICVLQMAPDYSQNVLPGGRSPQEEVVSHGIDMAAESNPGTAFPSLGSA